jgi:hypothetical protein
MPSVSHLFIVGAGFSSNAGLPLTGAFTKALVDVRRLRSSGPSNKLVEYLKSFVEETFGARAADSQVWPDLEDVFTLLDLSANTGHHLGPNYSAAELRTVRRALIVRLIRMLQQKFNRGKGAAGAKWVALSEFFDRLELTEVAMLSLNWDCVIENSLEARKRVSLIDYGNGAVRARFVGKDVKLSESRPGPFQLLKPHGSINWLYCDACRKLLWFETKDIEQIAQTLFKEKDWQNVDLKMENGEFRKLRDPICPVCGSHALGTRLATFSYRKALDFPMYAATWRQAETLLRDARTWIFIGYSMPAADFEFKYLLKRVELSRKKKPDIVVITAGGDAGTTVARYTNFFGVGRIRSYRKGLSDDALTRLAEVGALTRSSKS